MAKQLEFNKKEQDIITGALMDINKILVEKMYDGVTAPCLQGTMTIDDEEGLEVNWVFNVERK